MIGGAAVRQQRERDAALLAERRENFGRVVADGRQPEALVLQLLQPALQLNELRFAVRSPVGGTVEHEHGPAGAHDRFARPDPACLIGEAEVGNLLADLRTERRDVHGRRGGRLGRRELPEEAGQQKGRGSPNGALKRA